MITPEAELLVGSARLRESLALRCLSSGGNKSRRGGGQSSYLGISRAAKSLKYFDNETKRQRKIRRSIYKVDPGDVVDLWRERKGSWSPITLAVAAKRLSKQGGQHWNNSGPQEQGRNGGGNSDCDDDFLRAVRTFVVKDFRSLGAGGYVHSVSLLSLHSKVDSSVMRVVRGEGGAWLVKQLRNRFGWCLVDLLAIEGVKARMSAGDVEGVIGGEAIHALSKVRFNFFFLGGGWVWVFGSGPLFPRPWLSTSFRPRFGSEF